MPETLAIPTAARTEVPPDSLYEVIDGRVVEKPLMGAFESWIATRLALLMYSTGVVSRFGQVIVEALFKLPSNRNLKRRPDLAFVSFERWAEDRAVPVEEAWDVVPDLAVEVISRSNTFSEVVDKLDEYFQAGVRLVWVITPVQQKAYVYTSPTAVRILEASDDLEGGDVLPGFRLALKDLFRS